VLWGTEELPLSSHSAVPRLDSRHVDTLFPLSGQVGAIYFVTASELKGLPFSIICERLVFVPQWMNLLFQIEENL